MVKLPPKCMAFFKPNWERTSMQMKQCKIDELNWEQILQSMAVSDGSIRVLIATIAYGTGVDYVIHYGPCKNLRPTCKRVELLAEQALKCANQYCCTPV